MSNTVTNGIRIKVNAEYLETESDPNKGNFLFAYHITISNEGATNAQLMNRHWIITNANGFQQEVRGPGVVGHQPLLRPGESFKYSSYCPLDTPVGTMEGSYQMIENEQKLFEARINPFTLAVPGMLQ